MKNQAKKTKNKKAQTVKLRTILGDPFVKRERCPTLNDVELEEFGKICLEALQQSSDKKPKLSELGINLGLESSLRAINNAKVSFVLISLNLKPHFLVSLIARNVDVNSKKAPVFVTKSLETFTEKTFGIKSVILSLTANIKEELKEWLEKYKKPERTPKPTYPNYETAKKTIKKEKAQKRKLEEMQQIVEPMQTEDIGVSEVRKKIFGGDYIPIESEEETTHISHKPSEDHLSKALAKMAEINLIEITKSKKENALAKKIDEKEKDCQSASAEVHSSSDSDDFLSKSDYQPLILQKIQTNPNKKPKKKRKNKNKNKQNFKK